jgi:hypothetical protein
MGCGSAIASEHYVGYHYRRQRIIGRRYATVEGALLRAERPSIASRNTYRTPIAPATQPRLQSLTDT